MKGEYVFKCLPDKLIIQDLKAVIQIKTNNSSDPDQ